MGVQPDWDAMNDHELLQAILRELRRIAEALENVPVTVTNTVTVDGSVTAYEPRG